MGWGDEIKMNPEERMVIDELSQARAQAQALLESNKYLRQVNDKLVKETHNMSEAISYMQDYLETIEGHISEGTCSIDAIRKLIRDNRKREEETYNG